MRVGIIGCGFIANVHSWSLWALRKTGVADVRVVAVCDRDAERAAKFAEPHRAAVLDVEPLLGEVDVVYVCTPTATHRALAEAAADRDLPIFCEKPLATNLEEAMAVARQLERVPHQVGLVLRASPVFTAIADEIASGRHGAPMSVTMRDDQFFPIQGHYASSWRAELASAGGGTLIEHSIHDVDLFRWLLGEPNGVSCRTASFFGYEGIDDLATASFAYEGSGVVANLISVWHQVMTRPSTRRLEVFCERAHLWTEDDNTGPLHIETSDGSQVRECPLPLWTNDIPVAAEVQKSLGLYAEASRRFLAALSTGTSGSPSAGEALAAHRIVDAAYTSARRGGVPIAL